MNIKRQLEERYQRAATKKVIIMSLINELLYYIKKEQLDELDTILVMHRVMTSTTNFMFRGQVYGYTPRAAPKPGKLHANLYPAMIEWKNNQEAMETEESVMTSYLASAMSVSNNPNDWVALVHDYFKESLTKQATAHDFKFEPVSISEDFIKRFQQRQDLPIEYLKTRLTYNFSKKFCEQ